MVCHATLPPSFSPSSPLLFPPLTPSSPLPLSHPSLLSLSPSLPYLPFPLLPSSSAGDEPQTETTIIQDIYIDPLDQCMEGIEDLATGILRTGKLGLQGEPGGAVRC